MPPRVLLMLDTDAQPSVFDAVVAVDAGVDHLLRHGGVVPRAVTNLVYGAMFTRGGDDLRRTAIFVGGSDVAAAEAVYKAVGDTFFGDVRNSVMLDPNGANTTAAAAVLAARQHVRLREATVVVLGATGPVGRRVARLLATEGAQIRVASRSAERAAEVCVQIAKTSPHAQLSSYTTKADEDLAAVLDGTQVVVAAGTTGVELLSEQQRQDAESLQVAIDLNAVPPLGIGGIEVGDRGTERDGCHCYGAIGVGKDKMAIHKAAIDKLFTANDLTLDAEETYRLACSL